MNSNASEVVVLALCGDVMTGRGIDQILPHAGDSSLHEVYVKDAREYVALAMQASGKFHTPVEFDYVWGDARAALAAADVRIVNLETSITSANQPWPAKGIHYRMHPKNAGCLTAARLSCCGLANNHVLDWGYAGLTETLYALRAAGIGFAGAGMNLAEAAAPSALPVPNKGRVLVAAIGSTTSGIPGQWAATDARAGINLVREWNPAMARRIAQDLLRISHPEDVTVVSIHWGENWGYEIPSTQIEFAHALADEGIDVIHGHSSHHAKAVELRRRSVILYGCGDFLNDYEGISGHEEFRGDLSLLYQIKLGLAPRRWLEVRAFPFELRQLRLNHASSSDAQWLCSVLDKQSRRFDTAVELNRDNSLSIRRRA